MNTSEYDAIIVGAGALGVFTSFYYLTKTNPNGRPLLIDKNLMGSGATYYSLGVMYPYGLNERKRTLTLQSTAAWQEIQNLIKDIAFVHRPFYVLTKESSDDLKKRFVDPDMAILTDGLMNLKESFSWFQCDESATCFGMSEATQADPRQVILQICHYLKEKTSLTLLESMKVLHFSSDKNGVEITTSTQEKFSSKKLLLAVGPWIKSLITSELCASLHLRTKKIMSFHIDEKTKKSDPMIFLPDEEAFLIPSENTNQWQLSLTSREYDVDPDQPQFYLQQKDEQFARSILDRYTKNWSKRLRGGRVFCDTYGADNTPVIQELPEYPNVILISGSGIGFRLGPALAWEAALLLA